MRSPLSEKEPSLLDKSVTAVPGPLMLMLAPSRGVAGVAEPVAVAAAATKTLPLRE